MFCPKCKKEVQSDLLVCPDCGKKLFKRFDPFVLISYLSLALFVLLISIPLIRLRVVAITGNRHMGIIEYFVQEIVKFFNNLFYK